ncbi:hypothetical protein WN944_013570 [Citrus x changshan-huyou]|uniref:3-hydroxyisobutyryl-CoA hydrolase n=1 Tax=Citrus x changshan-huyou TaxID=2935761 RepID=A0AAP0M8A0_9ROSI
MCRFPSLISNRGLRSSLNNGKNYYNDHPHSLVLVEERANSRTVILNRPHVLNALNASMGALLTKQYESWENNSGVDFVVIKGNGRSFCAGEDVVSAYRMLKEGRVEECKQLFRTLYSFVYLVATYSKPHVAIMDGITMGGGAGIAVPASYRLATEKTVFAMPEVLIGFHPDVGSSYYLSRLPGHLGREYLGLTGATLSGEEMLFCGLATHYSLSARLPLIEDQLGTLLTDDFSAVGTFLGKYSDPVHLNQNHIFHKYEILNKCFSHGTVEEIIHALESEAAKTKDEWCVSTLEKLKEAPPLSLKVSLKSIRQGRFQTLEQCLMREYRMTNQAIFGQVSNNFCEGVRARLVDKSFTPKWYPLRLEQVTEDMVNAYFERLSWDEPDLQLPSPNKLRGLSLSHVMSRL